MTQASALREVTERLMRDEDHRDTDGKTQSR
jgi:hypothetical protein